VERLLVRVEADVVREPVGASVRDLLAVLVERDEPDLVSRRPVVAELPDADPSVVAVCE
jgi:hypothetical protein